jgi:hypothetical protein
MCFIISPIPYLLLFAFYISFSQLWSPPADGSHESDAGEGAPLSALKPRHWVDGGHNRENAM